MTWETAVAMVAALGGLELLKWGFTRRANIRQANAEAKGAEFDTLKSTIEFLQQQLRQSEEKYAELVLRQRRTQDELLKACGETFEARLELALKKCEDIDCPFRQPPNAHTKPMQGITKEEYHANKP